MGRHTHPLMAGGAAALGAQVASAAIVIALIVYPQAGELSVSQEPRGRPSEDDFEYWQQLRERDGLPRLRKADFRASAGKQAAAPTARQQVARSPPRAVSPSKQRTERRRQSHAGAPLPAESSTLASSAPSLPNQHDQVPTSRASASSGSTAPEVVESPEACAETRVSELAAAASTRFMEPAEILAHERQTHPSGPQLIRSSSAPPLPSAPSSPELQATPKMHGLKAGIGTAAAAISVSEAAGAAEVRDVTHAKGASASRGEPLTMLLTERPLSVRRRDFSDDLIGASMTPSSQISAFDQQLDSVAAIPRTITLESREIRVRRRAEDHQRHMR